MTARQTADLIASHAAALTLFARQWCDSPEDAVQDAFYKLIRLRTPPDDPIAWLFKVVRTTAIDLGRSARRRAKREVAIARPERWFAEREIEGLDAEAAIAALESLPGEQREAIVGRLWGGMTLEQVAIVAGCSITTAHRRYETGLQVLRERLGVICPK
ncbi:MAG: sigma-70 family RNA polymerase sigma factor [Planctomycetaceae bacterium]|nr:sigma-70 family RNA polymerase sigma factor [Planctomycetaceae bacterium]